METRLGMEWGINSEPEFCNCCYTRVSKPNLTNGSLLSPVGQNGFMFSEKDSKSSAVAACLKGRHLIFFVFGNFITVKPNILGNIGSSTTLKIRLT